MILSDHFCDNWNVRVGNWPTVPMVAAIIRQSVPVHPCRQLYDENGNPYRVYAIYWHPDLDLIIKVDEIAGKVVTCLSRDNFEQRNVPDETERKINRARSRKKTGNPRQRQAVLHRHP